jgi:hypothetical protein
VVKRVLKWTVPVDDKEHLIGAGRVLHVDCQTGPHEVQVWTEEREDRPFPQVRAQVFGTGHTFPNRGRAVGSVPTSLGPAPLVWHVVVYS